MRASPTPLSASSSSSSNNNARRDANMVKLSPSLKSLVSASFARPGSVPASPAIRHTYQSIAQDAAARKVGLKPWLAIS
ncbi:hypothetical protein E4U54_003316, partial [Claviceps lovelessii]